MRPEWLTTLSQVLPQTLALAVVKSSTGEELYLVETGLEDEVDLEAVLLTAIDFSLGDELLEMQSVIRDDADFGTGRRETLLLSGEVVLLFVRDPALDDSTLVVVCRSSANLGLVLAQVRQGIPGAAAEVSA